MKVNRIKVIVDKVKVEVDSDRSLIVVTTDNYIYDSLIVGNYD